MLLSLLFQSKEQQIILLLKLTAGQEVVNCQHNIFVIGPTLGSRKPQQIFFLIKISNLLKRIFTSTHSYGQEKCRKMINDLCVNVAMLLFNVAAAKVAILHLQNNYFFVEKQSQLNLLCSSLVD